MSANSSEWKPVAIAIGPGILYKGRYEYRVESRPPSANKDAINCRMVGAELTEWLNEYGAHGWALCAVREDAYGASEFFFRRELA